MDKEAWIAGFMRGLAAGRKCGKPTRKWLGTMGLIDRSSMAVLSREDSDRKGYHMARLMHHEGAFDGIPGL